MKLEDKSDMFVSESRQMRLTQRGYIRLINHHFSAVGAVECTDNLE